MWERKRDPGVWDADRRALVECVSKEPHRAWDINSWLHLLYSDAVSRIGESFGRADGPNSHMPEAHGLQAGEAHSSDSSARAYNPKLSKLGTISSPCSGLSKL